MSSDTVIKSKIYVEDLDLATGGTNAAETGTRQTSTGGTLAVTKLDASHIKFRSAANSLENLIDGTVVLSTADLPTGIPATNIADGSISNTEFQLLNGVTALPTAAAAQSDQETGTSTTTFVSPGRQQFHQSACKMWVQCGVAGGAPTVAYNVTTTTDDATGAVGITIATDFSGATYGIFALARSSLARMVTVSDSGQSAGSLQVLSFDAAGNAADPSVGYYIAAFGDQ